ncbi:hypothetical protein GGR55DRAFT_676835 [Xylaria sp. FL0064]|nr:hypothetical protein GGR55DRAFT_676835 [Xylaria sp. FL0064]
MNRKLLSFQSSLRRVTAGSSNYQTGQPDESTPLVGSTPRDDSERGGWRGIQWRVAGVDSDNPIIKWPARFLYFVNVILLCGVLGDRLGWPPGVILGLIATSILPMIAILDFLTEALSQTMGEMSGGLFNTFAGSIGGIAVRATLLGHGQIRLTQASILGQLLFTLLLIPGACFLVSGLTALRYASGTVQSFTSPALIHSSVHLIIPSLVIVIPSAVLPLLEATGSKAYQYGLHLMSCVAALLLAIFCCVWMLFELRTHTSLYSAEGDLSDEDIQEYEEEGPLLSRPLAGISTLFVTFIIILCSSFMADVIQRSEDTHGIDPAFLGLVFIPIITSGAEGLVAVMVAWKGKIELSIGAILASSVQFLLVSTPVLVFLGVALRGRPMTLYFTTAEAFSGVLSVALIAYILQRGEANYLDGVMLIGLYIIIVSGFILSAVSA